MRWALCLLVACGGPPRTEAPLERAPTRVAAIDAAPPADANLDPDRDGLIGACDLCPDDPETFNGILDEDGCPDSSGQSHSVMMDPTNRHASPIKVRFKGDAPIDTLQPVMFDDGIEVIDVIARSRVDVKPAVASKRAAIVAKQLREVVLASIRIEERVTGATKIYIDDDVTSDPDADVLIQVMRARAIDVWRWEDDHLVRATPRRRMPVPKLPAGC